MSIYSFDWPILPILLSIMFIRYADCANLLVIFSLNSAGDISVCMYFQQLIFGHVRLFLYIT